MGEQPVTRSRLHQKDRAQSYHSTKELKSYQTAESTDLSLLDKYAQEAKHWTIIKVDARELKKTVYVD